MSDVFEVSFVFHRNDVGRLQTVTVHIEQIHSVDIVSIGTEIIIYIVYFFNKIFGYLKKIVNFGMRHLPHLPQCSYGHELTPCLFKDPARPWPAGHTGRTHITTSPKQPILTKLGLQISEDLKWTTQITNVAKKANSTLGFLRRNLRFCPKECKKTAYISLVRSTIEYGAIVWDPDTTSDINKLERIQRRAVRFITGDYKTREEGSVTNVLNDLKLENLQLRRTSLRLVFLYKMVEGLVPVINPYEFLVKSKPKRSIKPKRFDNFESANIVNNSVKNNSKALETTVTSMCNTEQY